jgi:hypothetical protein
MNRKSADPWGASLCVLVPVVAALAGCSHDWDLLDPALSNGGSGAGGGGMGGSSGGGTTSAQGGGSGGTTTTTTSGSGGSTTTTTTTSGGGECTQDGDCPVSANPCVSSVCQSGACNTVKEPDDTVVSAGTASNCLDTVCIDGRTQMVPSSENCDDPVPTNCVVPSCGGDGVCSGTNAPQGSACLTANNVAGFCDGNGTCL